MSVATWRRELDRLAARVVPPPVPLTGPELARKAGLDPDPWQDQVLTSTAPRLLLNCARQTGKSTTTAILAVQTAVYQPVSLTLLLSPGLRQSQELFKKCLRVYRALGRPVPPAAENALSLELENGSRIVSLPGREETIRGFSGVQLLLIDEAARVPTALYASVRPMLAVSGGRLLAMSTPFGTRGWWFEAWRGDETWERVQVMAADCPRIPATFLAEERRALGDWWYRQEYECAFEDAETQAFRREDIERALHGEEIEAWAL